MNPTMLAYSLVLLLSVFVSAISQVILKKASLREYDSPIREYLNAPVIFAYVLFIGCTLLTILAYQGIPLSLGPVLEATSYIYIVIFGAIFFKEKITAKKIAALSIIICGIIVFACLG